MMQSSHRWILKIAVVVLLLLYLQTFSLAQSTLFNKAYYYNNNFTYTQTDLSTAMLADSSGYMIASRVWNYSSGNAFFHIIKTDLFGDTLFSKAYGDPGYQLDMISMKKTRGNEFILCGVKGNPSTKEVKGMIIKINALGDTLWTKTYSSGLLKTIFIQFVETAKGEIVVAGWTNNLNVNAKAFVMKMDSMGSKIWDYSYEKIGHDVYVNSIVETSDSGYLIAGSGTNWHNILLQKIDEHGKLRWSKLFWPIDEFVLDLLSLSDGTFLLGGGKGVNESDGKSGSANFLYKVDTAGHIVWNKIINASIKSEEYSKLLELSDQSIIAVGATSDTPGGNETGWLVKHNSSGDTLWSRKYAYENNFDKDGFFYDVKQTINQGLVMCGFTNGPSGTQDVWMISVDSLGCDTVGCLMSGIDEKALIIPIEILPIPCNQFLQINLPNQYFSQKVSVSFYDLTSRLVKTADFFGMDSNSISVTELPNGVYMTRISSSTKIIFYKKIIVIH